MSKIDSAIRELKTIDQMAGEDQWMNRIHPLVKLFLTVFYIVLTVSVSRYNLPGCALMAVYPVVLFIIGEISVIDALRRLRIVLPLVLIVGIFNPFFDREIVVQIGSVPVSGGVLSMFTLMIKAVLTVLASYLLIVTTSIEEICYALRLLHVPQLFVTEVLLIYRYITVLLKEAGRVTQAYQLRAPGQKGIAFRAWGPLLGQMLLRSMDRAEVLYQSMCIRGFRGQFYLSPRKTRSSDPDQGRKQTRSDVLYLLIWTAILVLFRFFPVSEFVGSLLRL